MSTHYAGWAIHPNVQAQLLKMYEPIHPEVRCEHITFQPVILSAPPPPMAAVIVRGMFEDDVTQALVVQVNGVVVRPFDKHLFHVTISHVPRFKSRLTGERMKLRPDLVHSITPWAIIGCRPFVRRIANGDW